MSKFAKNIRVLRNLKNLSQEQLSTELDIPRSRLGSYEEGRAEPPYEMLIKLSDYFHVAIDAMVRGDLSKTDPTALMKIGKNRILFPVMVDKENNDIIEVVPIKASAGYLTGFANPEFVQDLPVMNLPFKVVGKHRAFTIKGDSMPPLKTGDMVIGKYIESLNEITDGLTYVVLTKDDGLTYKRVYRKNPKKNDSFIFKSDNQNYTPYEVNSSEIFEAWSFVCSINIGEVKKQDLNIEKVIQFLQSYRVEMKR